MACELGKLVTGYPVPEVVRVRAVEDYGVFCEQPHPILKRITTPRKRHIVATFERLAQQRPRRHWMYIARREDRPVGTAIVYLDGGAASLVGTSG